MRWLPWALGTAGILQYAVIAAIQPSDYVGVDMAYLVMWLAIIGGVLACYLSCMGGGCGGYGSGCGYGDDGCDCSHCGGCSSGNCCGKCECCGPSKKDGGHEGHSH